MEIRNIQVKGYGFLQLILDEKTALIDCAMNINCEEVEEGLKEHLGKRKLDYVLLTHSHFDHVGTLSHIRKLYPEVKVFASEKTAKVFPISERPFILPIIFSESCEKSSIVSLKVKAG